MEEILQQWKTKQFGSFYWVESEEEYLVRQLGEWALANIVEESAQPFDQMVVFGKNIQAEQLMEHCRQLPVLSPKRLIVLKEAHHMRDVFAFVEALAAQPCPDTVLIALVPVKYAESKVKLKQKLRTLGEYVFIRRKYENEQIIWAVSYAKKKGLELRDDVARLLVDATGGYLSRIANELDKLFLLSDVQQAKKISLAHVQKYVGVGKEYNVFEFIGAISTGDTAKMARIIRYLREHAHHIVPVAWQIALYDFFARVLLCFEHQHLPTHELASVLKVSPFFVREYQAACRRYTYEQVENFIFLLFDSHKRTLGIESVHKNKMDLLLEFFSKCFLTGGKAARTVF